MIGLIDCAGLRLQEGTDALQAFGSIYAKQALASGVIPQITAVFGTCGGGAAILSGLPISHSWKKKESFLSIPRMRSRAITLENALSQSRQRRPVM